MNSPPEKNCDRAFRKSDDWVRSSLIATVVTVAIGTVGFAIQITNLTRIYEQRQTTVEVDLKHISEELKDIKSRIDKWHN